MTIRRTVKRVIDGDIFPKGWKVAPSIALFTETLSKLIEK